MSKIIEAKICMIGDSGVGKTSIIQRAISQNFQEDVTQTVVVSFQTYALTLDEKTTIHFNVWDTAGQENYRSMLPMYLRDAAGFFLVFDVSSRSSFDNLNDWIEQLEAENYDLSNVMLLGNKIDKKNRVISTNDGNDFADQKGFCGYQDCSAKSGEGIEESFFALGIHLSENKRENVEQNQEPIDINHETVKANKQCC